MHLSFCVSFVCPSVHHTLFLNHLAKFNQNCFITFSHGKGVGKQHHFLVCPSICAFIISPSVCNAISQTTRQKSTKLATSRPLMVRCAKATSFFHASVCLSVHLSSFICLSCYLLHFWAKFNQLCCMTSPQGKGV